MKKKHIEPKELSWQQCDYLLAFLKEKTDQNICDGCSFHELAIEYRIMGVLSEMMQPENIEDFAETCSI